MSSGIDLSGQVFAAYEKALARARLRQQQNKLDEAAAAYRQCASYLEQYIRYVRSPDLRQRWQDKAEQYRRLAAQMEQGSFAAPRSEEGMGDASPEAYEEAITALIHHSPVTWNDIAGLEETKREIKAAYGLALARKPEGVHVEGWRNILFYGPPGTGKTLLAAATSNGLEATFFNVRVSDLLSKYFGESTKLISALFSVARREAPSVIFLDEIESLTPPRDSAQGGPETRIISTFLAEMDGLAQKKDPRLVLTIAATNVPWLMDKAILSRFEKKIFIPLPDEAARRHLLELEITHKGHRSTVPLAELVQRTAGYSGREIAQLCKEAIKEMIQRENPAIEGVVDQGREAVADYELQVRPLTRRDWDTALGRILPQTSKKDIERFETWRRDLD